MPTKCRPPPAKRTSPNNSFFAARKFADFQPKNTFDLAKVKRGRDIGEFVQNSQRYQAITVRYTTEVLRRLICVVAVVAPALPGDEEMEDVVQIVIPLRSIALCAATAPGQTARPDVPVLTVPRPFRSSPSRPRRPAPQ